MLHHPQHPISPSFLGAVCIMRPVRSPVKTLGDNPLCTFFYNKIKFQSALFEMCIMNVI